VNTEEIASDTSPVPIPDVKNAYPTPLVGRIVHYVLTGGRNSGEHRPAIIVRRWSSASETVQLQVLTDASNDYPSEQVGANGLMWATSVGHDEKTKAVGTWHWPESE
jgi:hypothetical protein